jgi:D-3-phosphoglycerate dehydrogenase / 2-oxoglutarate reductase
VVERPTLPPAELLEEIGEFDALVGRSATRITAELLERGDRLRWWGARGWVSTTWTWSAPPSWGSR